MSVSKQRKGRQELRSKLNLRFQEDDHDSDSPLSIEEASTEMQVQNFHEPNSFVTPDKKTLQKFTDLNA
jgi:hypothetical protein